MSITATEARELSEQSLTANRTENLECCKKNLYDNIKSASEEGLHFVLINVPQEHYTDIALEAANLGYTVSGYEAPGKFLYISWQ